MTTGMSGGGGGGGGRPEGRTDDAGAPTGNGSALAGWRRFVAARFDPKEYLGLHLTLGLVVAVLGLWLFGALLDAVLDNAMLVHWDQAVDAWVHARTTATGLRVFDVITQLGSPAAMGALAVVGLIVLWVQRRRTALITWLAAFVGGNVLDEILKLLVHRARPAFGAAYLHGHTYSFPSGHAMGSIIGYTMLIYLLRLYWHPRREQRWLVIGAAALLIVLVGVSRVYLGVHYPSDVIGGWAAGAAWLAVCLTGLWVAQGAARNGRSSAATAAAAGGAREAAR